jgi:hypothetical protein
MEKVAVNKWIRVALGAAVALIGYLIGVHWTDFLDARTAGVLALVLGALQTVIAAIAPAAGDPVQSLRGTGLKGLVFTHKTVKNQSDGLDALLR